MTRVTWDNSTDKTYSTGVYRGVLYPKNSPGVAWNGLISVTEKGDDNTTSIALDGQLAVAESLPGTFAGSLTAYMYPDELEPSLGNSGGFTGQPRVPFGLCYRDNHQIHILYNVLLQPGSDKFQTLSDNPTAVAFGWDFTTVPSDLTGYRPSSHLVIMVDEASSDALAALEDVLYGNAQNQPSLPSPDVIADLLLQYSPVQFFDNLDGTWSASGPEDVITMLDDSTFQIDWSMIRPLSSTTYFMRALTYAISVTDHGDGSFTVTAPDSFVFMLDSNTFEATGNFVQSIDSSSFTISSRLWR